MSKKTILFILLLQACSSFSKTDLSSSSPKSIELNRVVDQYFDDFLKMNPLFATSIGDHRFDDELTLSLTQESRKQALELNQEAVAAVTQLGCDHLNHQDTLTCEMFLDDLTSEQALMLSDLSYLMPFNQFDSFFSNFAELASGSSYVTFETLKDYDHFIKRMEVVPAYIDSMIANMRLGVKKKITTPRVLVDQALKQIHALTPARYQESVFYKPLLKLDSVAKSTEADLVREKYENMIVDSVYPAYKKLENYVKNEYRVHARKTHGLGKLVGGAKNYQALVRMNTTTTLTPDEIHELGLNEVKRIRNEFEKVKESLGFNGSLAAFFKSIRNNKSLYPFHSSEEVLNAYRAIYGRVMLQVPAHFHLMPKAKFEIREVEKFKAENASEAYQNGTADGARPGIFWVPVPHPEKYGAKDMESLFLHEAIPGHHFQISIQQESDLPRYRRYNRDNVYYNGNNAYVEGWALYTEGLGKDLGLYTDPYQWIGRLSGEMHRAIRLVVDTGMHVKGWSREKAIAYSLENEPGDREGIVSEIERYLAIPGQALSYKLGELKILELKHLAQGTLGAKYTDASFHDEILKDGALPLVVLERKIREWLANSKQ